MSKFIFPLGSECWANDALSMSELEPYKIYKSPFNGTRILNYMAGVMPVKSLLDSPGTFRSLYCNPNNWTIITDGCDIQALNFELNLRRCHLKKDNIFSFCGEVEAALDEFESRKKELLYILDLNDYMWFRRSELEGLKKSLDLNIGHRTLFYFRRLNAEHLDGWKEKLEVLQKVFGQVQILKSTACAKTCYMNFFNTNKEVLLKLGRESQDVVVGYINCITSFAN